MFKLLKSRFRRISPQQLTVIVFFGIVLFGTLLLALPFSSRSGQSAGVINSLFTATSATCVTGLIVRDTWLQWSWFGQTVILVLIQIGGLGFMAVVSIFMLLFRRRFGMKDRMVLSQGFGLDSQEGVVRMMRRALLGTLLIEGTGALILTIRFSFDVPFFHALRLGIWHSVSAFCNAGFDILGYATPGQSLIPYNNDAAVNVTVMLLIILGGLGFFVWDDICRNRSLKKLSPYSKLVLLTTCSLLLFGTAVYLLLEWNNPKTLGNMGPAQKLLAAAFQSVTTRTAGFDAVGQGNLTESSKAATVLLMLVGGSSGSTAGGLKTVTFAVVLLYALSSARGRHNLTLFHRNVPRKQIINAFTLATLMIGLIFVGGIVICSLDGVSFLDGLYEAASALATVGLTTGITSGLCVASKLMLTAFMFFGRVGLMTISVGFLVRKNASESYRYADTIMLIG